MTARIEKAQFSEALPSVGTSRCSLGGRRLRCRVVGESEVKVHMSRCLP